MENVVIEDGEPVDSILAEKHMRFLTHTLYTNWMSVGDDKRFMVNANVGIFSELLENPIVPDVMLSLGVETPSDWKDKRDSSYFVDRFGKPPEITIEIVSNKKGHERDKKLRDYAILGVKYYVIYDPYFVYQKSELECYKLEKSGYELQDRCMFKDIGLGLRIWDGEFEFCSGRWLRWCDKNGKLVLTGKELAEQERKLAERERLKTDLEIKKRQEAEKRAELLAKRLKELGVEP